MPTRPYDLLLVTATRVESQAMVEVFQEATQRQVQAIEVAGRTYFDFGTFNEMRLFMTQSEMGSHSLGASMQTVQKGIEALKPRAVVLVGIAFGINEEKQAMGDILVTTQLRLYELQRVGTVDGSVKIILRDDKPQASPWLLNRFRSADVLWPGAKVHFGVVLTGEKLVDNIDFREQLHKFEPEAIGGEMEGAGLYVACQDKHVDWILVKAICDWADGNKSEEKSSRQQTAAKNAASFVLHAFRLTPLRPDPLPPVSGTVDSIVKLDARERFREDRVQQRVCEIWSTLSRGKRAFLDILLHPEGRKLLEEVLAGVYSLVRIPESSQTSVTELHIVLEAVQIMPDSCLDKVSNNPQTAIFPYLAEALGVIVSKNPLPSPGGIVPRSGPGQPGLRGRS